MRRPDWIGRTGYVPTLTAVFVCSSSLDPRLAELILEELLPSLTAVAWDMVRGEEGGFAWEAIFFVL
jgi:hypothetical protein